MFLLLKKKHLAFLCSVYVVELTKLNQNVNMDMFLYVLFQYSKNANH